MKTFQFKLNKNKFDSTKPKIYGKEILETGGLTPTEDYELLIKINERGFEPVQLDEEIDLRQPGIEGFRASKYDKVTIFVDELPIEIEERFSTPNNIIILSGKNPDEYYLVQTSGNKEIGYKNDPKHKVSIQNGLEFITYKFNDPPNNSFIYLLFIVNGTEVKIKSNLNAPLKIAVKKALKETGNEGRPLDELLIKYNGKDLDINKKIKELGLTDGAKIFITPISGEGGESKQITDPEVTKIKFDQEIEKFYKQQQSWREKGIVCVKSEYPIAEFVFIAKQLNALSIAFAVRVDFTDYDSSPPSVKFIDPITGDKILKKDLRLEFFQIKPSKSNGLPNGIQIQSKQPVVLGKSQDEPFFCIRGIREYHDHSRHSGDSWFLYRGTGVGNLSYILEHLYSHTIPHLRSYNIQYLIGFQQI